MKQKILANILIIASLGLSACEAGQMFGPSFTPAPTPDVGSMWISPKDGMVMMYVPAGEFTMGSNGGSDDEKPPHDVYLDAYWMDQTEVTNAMFAKFVDATGYVTDADKAGHSWVATHGQWMEVEGVDWNHPQGPGSSISGMDAYPVVHVSWNDAVAYCAWRGGRLPSEEEWEKAASWNPDTDQKTVFPWGNEFNRALINFCDTNCPFNWADKSVDDGYGFTAPAGHYPEGASFYGLLDMAGNVWEWVMDWYQAYPGNTRSNSDYGETHRLLHGGSWINLDYDLRSSYRNYYPAFITSDLVGFRCARSE